jgi:hypothetical protein
MTHLEDAVIDSGVKGTREAINFLRSLRDMLAGNADAPVAVSVKWDGAPAIFAGTDPSDGKFFIAKKGVFNKNPKIYKTNAEIDNDLSGDLGNKFKIALAELSKIGIKGVIQGDFLYSSDDIKTDTIDGEPHITFHPNTIVYAIPKKSELAKKILRSNIGVVWHTTYRGNSFETMSATFGEAIASNLKEISTVWSVDAVFKDTSGTATFTKKETAEITKILSDAGKIFQKVSKEVLNDISADSELNARVNTYINSKVRMGERVGDPKKFTAGLIKFIQDYYGKQVDKRKSEKGKTAQTDKMNSVLTYFDKHAPKEIENVFILYNLIVDAKHMVIDKMNNVDGLKTLLKTATGYEVTGQEGFVAIDRLGKNTLKLVDRLQFSKANFSADYIKGWQK